MNNKLLLSLLLGIAIVAVFSACSLSGKDKDRVYEVGVACIGLEGEEWRDCMMDESRMVAGNAVKEAIEEEISEEDINTD